MKQKRNTGKKLLSFLVVFAMITGLIPGMSMTAKATCYKTEKSSYQIDYSSDGTKVNSIVIDFVYGDDAHKTSGEGPIGRSSSGGSPGVFCGCAGGCGGREIYGLLVYQGK